MSPAPKGNQFWLLRSKHGRDKLFSSPKLLWDAACEYFQWCKDHPITANQAVKAGDHFGEQVMVDLDRPFTISGLCIYLDCDEDTLNNYGSNKDYKDYFGVVSKIKRIIYTQKFEGAAVGIFNANIIARDLGLSDLTKTEHSGEIKGQQIIFLTEKNRNDSGTKTDTGSGNP